MGQAATHVNIYIGEMTVPYNTSILESDLGKPKSERAIGFTSSSFMASPRFPKSPSQGTSWEHGNLQVVFFSLFRFHLSPFTSHTSFFGGSFLSPQKT